MLSKKALPQTSCLAFHLLLAGHDGDWASASPE